MARGIDHIVHAVHDLDAAAALYRALGFQVGARNTHAPSWGTRNHIVQLAGSFIEVLTVADGSQIAPHGPRHFSFGAHNRDALTRGEGLSMLVLASTDAHADAREFRGAGIGDFDVFDFEREGRRPDGTPIKVAFSLAFASDHGRAGHRLLHLPAPISGEFLESGISGSFQYRHKHRRRSAGGGEAVGPLSIPDLVHRRRRSGGLDERARRDDAAGRNPGDGSGVLRAQFRGEAPRHSPRGAACGACASPSEIWR